VKSLEYGALNVLQGVGLSPGVRRGRVCRLQSHGPVVQRLNIKADQIADELKQLAAAVNRTRQQLIEIKAQLQERLGGESASVLDAHLLILEDPTLQSSIQEKIEHDLTSSERAVQEVTEQLLSAYRSIEDPIFRERRFDLEEVLERLAFNLAELDPHHGSVSDEDLVLVAPTLSLSILAEFEVSRIRGLVSTRGGSASHLTIIARSLQIPMVGSIEDLTALRNGQRVLIDGDRGLVMVEPESWAGVVPPPARPATDLEPAEWNSPEVVTTLDGQVISLLANTELDNDLEQARDAGAEGIGLFRTEYLFMSRKDGAIDEEQQYRSYQRLAAAAGSHPVHVRTLDIGDEGHPYFEELAGETEPVLGLRGIRLGLEYPEILLPQIRAILRAACFGNLKIVFPMVSSVDEVIRARSIVDQARSDLAREGLSVPPVQVGVMLEVPAAILCLEALTEIADFFLVGTNDLIQYTLAIDRNAPRVAHLFQALHPAVLTSLARIAEVTKRADRPVTVCGEMATQSGLAGLLIGLGFRRLSMNPWSISTIRDHIRRMTLSDLESAAQQALSLKTIEEVERFIEETGLLGVSSSGRGLPT